MPLARPIPNGVTYAASVVYANGVHGIWWSDRPTLKEVADAVPLSSLHRDHGITDVVLWEVTHRAVAHERLVGNDQLELFEFL